MRREQWERAAEWPLTVAALAFLVAYAWPILDPGLGDPWASALRTVTTAVWVLFAVDYGARLALSPARWRFVRSTPLDLAVLVLPVLRPLRLLRLFTLLSVLDRYAGMSLRGRVAVYVGGSTALILLLGALTVLDVERAARGATITSFDDALWWALTTVTSVGYGDTYPVTGVGRAVAAALMLTGIALLGVVTASVATWLVDRVAAVDDEADAVRAREVRALTREVAALREELRQRPGGADGAPPRNKPAASGAP